MDADWITSPSARRVQQHAADSRPAWLWSQDGQLLLWQNDAAPLFLAKVKKHGLKLAPPALPIKGQIARNIRLGSPGRTSLARIQFIAGEKPASSTCATTPLIWQDGQTVLLVVGVDPIAEDVLAVAREDASIAESEVPVADALVVLADEQVSEPEAPAEEAPEAAEASVEPSAEPVFADEAAAPEAEVVEPVAEEDHEVVAAQEALDEVEHPDAQEDHGSTRPAASDEMVYAQELENWRATEGDGAPAFTPVLVPDDDAPVPVETVVEIAAPDDEPAEVVAEQDSIEDAVEPQPEAASPSRLSQLVDRLAAASALFTPLTEADDKPPEQAVPPSLFKVTGRGFVADAGETDGTVEQTESSEADEDLGNLAALDGNVAEQPEAAEIQIAEAVAELTPKPTDPEVVERVSRYNFDELARILTDRVGDPTPSTPPVAVPGEPVRSGALINLGGETLVLNRLPLGIMVFRDQQVLFANRAITEMVGYGSVESLRAAGLGAVFPAIGSDGEAGAGPVNHLVQRDGTLVPVTARLQSISWQGKPALMLSASTTEVRTGHETAVAAFARAFAELRGDGFLEATRTGVISASSGRASALLKASGMLDGKPLSAVVGGSDLAELRDFLERPARFAETARPALSLRSADGSAEIALFAQGQAGVITGYFGLVRGRELAPMRLPAAPADADPALLARISRGVRRPLNTIIGFADILRSETHGPFADERYQTYAQDITTAGQEIAGLVEELDEYSRLRDGRYMPQRASIELTSLLESCVLRIRQQASGARVIVRNAISESLPRVTADRASLAQAVLNLLASAIDQTPTGGGVVISAQREDDGSIAVHVRDSSDNAVDMAERFVVFRDGPGRDGQMLVPVRSSIGLALTRSLLAVNAFSLSVDPAGEQGMLFTMIIPADLVEEPTTPGSPE